MLVKIVAIDLDERITLMPLRNFHIADVEKFINFIREYGVKSDIAEYGFSKVELVTREEASPEFHVYVYLKNYLQ